MQHCKCIELHWNVLSRHHYFISPHKNTVRTLRAESRVRFPLLPHPHIYAIMHSIHTHTHSRFHSIRTYDTEFAFDVTLPKQATENYLTSNTHQETCPPEHTHAQITNNPRWAHTAWATRGWVCYTQPSRRNCACVLMCKIKARKKPARVLLPKPYTYIHCLHTKMSPSSLRRRETRGGQHHTNIREMKAKETPLSAVLLGYD